MEQVLPKVMGVEFNHEISAEINTTPASETPTWASLTEAFKNIGIALNESLYSAAYLADGGYSSSMVTGIAPVVTVTGDFMKKDPACIYFDETQWKTGKERITNIRIKRNGKTVTCSVTLTGIAIAGGEATGANAITVTIAFNGKPTIEPTTITSGTEATEPDTSETP